MSIKIKNQPISNYGAYPFATQRVAPLQARCRLGTPLTLRTAALRTPYRQLTQTPTRLKDSNFWHARLQTSWQFAIKLTQATHKITNVKMTLRKKFAIKINYFCNRSQPLPQMYAFCKATKISKGLHNKTIKGTTDCYII